VLLPGAKVKGVLLLGRMPQGSTATGGTSQGGSHRVLPPGNKESIATGGTPYGAYDIGKMLPPGEYYKREPQGAAIGEQKEYCH